MTETKAKDWPLTCVIGDFEMRRITVGEIHDTHTPASRSVDANTPMESVVRTFATSAAIQSIFVVEDDGRLVGAINRLDLLRWVAVKIVGGEASRSLTVGNIRRIVFAADASDLARRAPSVPSISVETDLAAALRMMMDSGEPVVPVVDKHGKLVGDLRVSEVLSAALEFDQSVRPSAAVESSAGHQ